MLSRVLVLSVLVVLAVSAVSGRQGSLEANADAPAPFQVPNVISRPPTSGAASTVPFHVPNVISKPPTTAGGAAAPAHLGSVCKFGAQTGTCTSLSSHCAGQRIAGKCPGDKDVQCCIVGNAAAPFNAANLKVADHGKDLTPQAADALKSDAANAAKLPKGPWTPAEAAAIATFPHKFPYATGRHIVSDFLQQRIRLYDGATALKEWRMSSGAKGVGFVNDFPASPMGRFKVVMKVGNKQPLGEIIEKLTPQKRIGKESDAFAHMQTRILVLDGLDKENANTRSRSIYIHGTNKESNLGKMASHGCFRMGNKDVIELFDAVDQGVEYFAIPMNAWPATSVPTGVIGKEAAAPAAAAPAAPNALPATKA